MLNCNFTIRLLVVLRKSLHYKTSIFSSFTDPITSVFKRAYSNELEQIFLKKSSIKSYLNPEKINLLKPYYKTKQELTCKYNFVIDDSIAKDIVDNTLLNNNQLKRIVVEGNPGLGLITNNLINSGISHIHIFDKSELKDVSLSQLLAHHSNKITLHKVNMHHNPDAVLLNSFDLGREKCLPVTIIGITTSFYFLRSLVSYFVNFHMWKHEFELFLVLSNTVRKALIKGSHNLRFNVHSVFHLLFIIEEMGKYPRSAFLPLSETNNEDMTLIRLTCNPDFVKSIAEEDLCDYFGFLGLLGRRKRNFIIPTLEKWVPDCGLYLIAKGVSMTMQVRELSPKEAMVLFNFIKKCNEYKSIKACIESFYN